MDTDILPTELVQEVKQAMLGFTVDNQEQCIIAEFLDQYLKRAARQRAEYISDRWLEEQVNVVQDMLEYLTDGMWDKDFFTL